MTARRASLKPEAWPVADARAWAQARRPPCRFEPGGAAGHLRPSSALMLQRAYGDYLAFCTEAHLIDPHAPPAGNVTRSAIDRYLRDQKARCRSVTVAIRMARILRMARLLAPGRAFDWLADIAADCKAAEIPRRKRHRIVDSARLLKAGLTMMDEALAGYEPTPLANARRYRNGLMLALLALHPIRLGNFATLRIGHELRRERDGWSLNLEPHATKSGRADERAIAAILTPRIDRWVDDLRHRFIDPQDAMWPSTKGGALAYTFVGEIISATTKREIGVDVSPHLFRHCAVHTIATRDGRNMGIASALLQHVDPRTTNDHYNRGSTHLAARVLQDLVRQLEEQE